MGEDDFGCLWAEVSIDSDGGFGAIEGDRDNFVGVNVKEGGVYVVGWDEGLAGRANELMLHFEFVL